MIGYYNYTVILTYASFVCAIIGIIAALTGNVHLAMILLMVSGFCDMIDGSVARMKKDRTPQEIAFGAHIDSLSDILAFGVLPAIILYGLGLRGIVCYVAMAFFALAALIRLAHFDVQEMFEIKQDANARRTHFTGLPVTNAAIILPGLMVVDIFLGIEYKYFYLVSMILVGIAFITPFKMKKLYFPALLIPTVIGVAIFVLLIIFGGVF